MLFDVSDQRKVRPTLQATEIQRLGDDLAGVRRAAGVAGLAPGVEGVALCLPQGAAPALVVAVDDGLDAVPAVGVLLPAGGAGGPALGQRAGRVVGPRGELGEALVADGQDRVGGAGADHVGGVGAQLAQLEGRGRDDARVDLRAELGELAPRGLVDVVGEGRAGGLDVARDGDDLGAADEELGHDVASVAVLQAEDLVADQVVTLAQVGGEDGACVSAVLDHHVDSPLAGRRVRGAIIGDLLQVDGGGSLVVGVDDAGLGAVGPGAVVHDDAVASRELDCPADRRLSVPPAGHVGGSEVGDGCRRGVAIQVHADACCLALSLSVAENLDHASVCLDTAQEGKRRDE
ncbi:hypothetical protein FJTKL_12859 [Diaporthe vaccinii]|uniref:Uncharacterized protein n=1 Tax=Diaporthe vaccinii TaxID=105482 RepID=A0ABR4F9T9_9PEZI